MENLVYTIAFDKPGSEVFRNMARLLFLSLRETGYKDEILVISNSPEALFRHHRHGLSEIYIDDENYDPQIIAKEYKFRAADLIDCNNYNHIYYLDCDCLVISRLTQTNFCSEKDITAAVESWGNITDDPFCAYLTESEMDTLDCRGMSSGIFRVRADKYSQIMAKWQTIYQSPRLRDSGCVDQPAWVRLLLDNNESVHLVAPMNQIRYPLAENMHVNAYESAVIMHYCGLPAAQRLNHMICDYARIFRPTCLAAFGEYLNLLKPDLFR